MTLLETVVVMMLTLSPAKYHAPLAIAIVHAVEAEDPLYQDDESRVKTASLLVAVSFREGSFRTGVKGDKGDSYGSFQAYLPGKTKTLEGYSGADLLDDPERQARVALRMIRESFKAAKACGSELGLYAAGPSCASDRSKRISADRMALARWLRTKVTP